MDIKKMKAALRNAELESMRLHGPRIGKGGLHQSKRDKANCPRRQRRNRDWERA